MIFFHFSIFVFALFHHVNCNDFYPDFLEPKSNIQSNQENEYQQENEYNDNLKSIQYSQQDYDLQENNTNNVFNLQSQNQSQSFNNILLNNLISYELGSYGDDKCEPSKFPVGGLIGNIANENWEGVFWNLKDFATPIISAGANDLLPGSGAVIGIISGNIQPGSPNAACLAQINANIVEGFRRVEAAIRELGAEVAYEISNSRYVMQVRSEINDYTKKIESFLSVTESTAAHTDFPNKCTTAGPGQIKTVVDNFELYLSTECSNGDCLPKELDGYLYQKFVDGNLNYDDFVGKRKQFMKMIVLDAGRLQYAAYLCSIVAEKTPNAQRENFKTLNQQISETLDKLPDFVMNYEIKKLSGFADTLKHVLEPEYNEIIQYKTPPILPNWIERHGHFVLENIWDQSDFMCFFVENGTEHRVINCPKTSCIFLPNTFGGHIVIIANIRRQSLLEGTGDLLNKLDEEDPKKQQILNEDQDSNFDGIIEKFKCYYPHNKEVRSQFVNTVFFYKQGSMAEPYVLADNRPFPKYNKVYKNNKVSVFELTSM